MKTTRMIVITLMAILLAMLQGCGPEQHERGSRGEAMVKDAESRLEAINKAHAEAEAWLTKAKESGAALSKAEAEQTERQKEADIANAKLTAAKKAANEILAQTPNKTDSSGGSPWILGAVIVALAFFCLVLFGLLRRQRQTPAARVSQDTFKDAPPPAAPQAPPGPAVAGPRMRPVGQVRA